MDKEKSKSAGWYPGKYYNSFVRSRKEKKAAEGLSRDFDSDNDNPVDDVITAANAVGGEQDCDDYQVVAASGSNEVSGKSTKIKSNFLPSILPVGPVGGGGKSELNVGKIRLILSNYQSMGTGDMVASPVIYVEIEGVHKVFKNINNASNIVTNFYFSDINSDIYILLIDESDGLIKGRIITSISSYMTLKGPKDDVTEWKLFLPLNDTSSAVTSSSISTYQSCHYTHVNGMVKTREIFPILNINTTIELLIPSPVMLYLNYPATDVSEAKNNADPNTYERDIQRVINIVQTPPIFVPFLTFPEGFVLIGLVSLVVFGISICYVPFVVYGTILLNGLLARPNYSYVTQYMPTRDKNSTATKAPLMSHQYVSLNLNRLRGIVCIMEKLQNITCFVDMNMSLIFYTLFLGLTVCTSIFLMLFSVKFVVFLGLMIGFLILVITNAPTKSQDDTEIQKYAYGYIVYRRLHAFWCRIPSTVTAEHRYISSLQNINPRKGVYKEYFKDTEIVTDSAPDSTTPVVEKPTVYTTAVSGIENSSEST